MAPTGLDGVLVAGRAVSATHEALGAIRVMPPCFAMGEAAGLAAATAVAGNGEVRAVDVRTLQQRLTAQGAYIGDDIDSRWESARAG